MNYLILHKIDDFCTEFETITWDQFEALCKRVHYYNTQNRSKKIVMTFDDGYASDLRAEERARAWQIDTIHFVVPHFVGLKGYMCQGDLRELGQRGAQIGVHSFFHNDLRTLNDEELSSDIFRCVSWANDFIKSRSLCYSIPYGKDNKKIQYNLSKNFASVFTTGSLTYFNNVYRRVGINRNNIETDIGKLIKVHNSKFWLAKYYAKELFIQIFGNTAYKFLRNMR